MNSFNPRMGHNGPNPDWMKKKNKKKRGHTYPVIPGQLFRLSELYRETDVGMDPTLNESFKVFHYVLLSEC
jgi:hypothetical protein